ncbi:type 12 methyltransferase [Alcanivorax hongdengensis A-11-3]|uniref:Type 12 methyltransferase n=1 Tax=Alcanivorax hongdengensis A-11-3 TaxID=1177179 RepID=L0WEQ9_9GAMM|nr:class I SAM-dependent methyltransferase [Alcanivorax hongdengensis]EKF75501.1 type 12 methyltransferase [Alcanivorax hongdengensis A-11-3]
MNKDAAHAGQAAYTPFTLPLYDRLVLGASCRWLWRCPSERILDHYQKQVSSNHLDVGVGSGYFLDHVAFRSDRPRLVLMDMNANSLAFCSRRIARYSPKLLQSNVLEPIDFDGARFDSLGMNFLLHCLPGDMHGKARALDHLKPLLNPGARVFGATLLHGGVERNLPARGLMHLYNRRGIFSNREDSLMALERELQGRFDAVEIHVQGCAALFAARVKD